MEKIKLLENNLSEVIEKSEKILRNGGVIVYPTDTCYGLGALASNSKAIEKIYNFKGREENKPFSVIVPSLDWIFKRIENLTQERKEFILDRLPGPYTFIVKIKESFLESLKPVLTKQKLGFRYPKSEFCQKLAASLNEPFTTTSANISGEPPAYSFGEFKRYLTKDNKKYIDLFIDGGELPKNKPSTIIDISIRPYKVLR